MTGSHDYEGGIFGCTDDRTNYFKAKIPTNYPDMTSVKTDIKKSATS